MNNLRMSSIQEPTLEASKWLSTQALLDADEMGKLCDSLGDFHLFLCGALCQPNESILGKEAFLEHYRSYIAALQNGQLPDPLTYRKWFSPAMTLSTEALYAISVSETQQLVRIARPVVQLQAHHMGYSPIDDKFRPMVFGNDSIPWGIQFSYPQLFRDSVTKQVEQTRHSPEFPNTELFQSIQKWMRAHTIPTPFLVNGQKINVPMRLGKGCLPWINNHPQLIAKGIRVDL